MSDIRPDGHVLVVEDNRINRMVAIQILKRMNVVAAEASSGAEALRLLADQDFDLVLMDVQMPGMDGLETSRRIRSGTDNVRNPSVPIVAMTAYAAAEDEQACYDAGMNSYVAKPLNMDQFMHTVRSALNADQE